MYAKIYIVDFEDSFTYNIANVLYEYEKNIVVVSHINFFEEKFFGELLKNQQNVAVIFGPGPGHPRQYKKYFQLISILKETKNIFIMGLCLGHQILGLMDGYTISDAAQKIHGQSVEINFYGNMVSVMRYNSLAVFDGEEECFFREAPRLISYQFHPESVGTKNKYLFFQRLLAFISS